ncbi:hypothetical protein PLESTB_000425200 [Pleodorina starrii]|uniref:Uncharacterized protein n=1 Tax=Pleodorina starrii TaxID=330485 RepID=A0A9W6EZL4_9CHLO|nr:hypothetical protein PLESTM_001698900 [Pleodorina starrii]GLC50729.1 hypothetical protein PLESTB_000425200 [Pleodorina starrii]GLC74366.1 hypothetical protein PLESTF_001504300 [Pleodorina starrii]
MCAVTVFDAVRAFVKMTVAGLLVLCTALAVARCCHAVEAPPNSRNAYVDKVIDPRAASSVLPPAFKKLATTAVVYMCYNRTEMIRLALESVLKSEGLNQFDVIISQDGGDGGAQLNVSVPTGTNFAYIRHSENLNAGVHHYFVRNLAFAVLGYDNLIIIEEDNILHPQAIQMLKHMLDMSLQDLEIGLVSIVDADNSNIVDMTRYGSHVIRVVISEGGHNWAYGMHASRFRAVRQHLLDYVKIIAHEDYRMLHADPLAANIKAMYARKGVPLTIPLSQDANLQFSLRLEGFDRRLTTVARLMRPIGHWGLHFREDSTIFFDRFGREMYSGRVALPPRETSREDEADMARNCRLAVDKLFVENLGRHPDEKALSFAVSRLLAGRMNGVVLVACVTRTAKRRTPECRDMYWV